MKAIVIQPGTKAPRLVWEEVPEPGFGPGEVMVAVVATAVNLADLLQARGLYPAPRRFWGSRCPEPSPPSGRKSPGGGRATVGTIFGN
jgi:NADPH:quinone reductase-like Zn-dependent oxidoreductase